jgi:hypothetical protein
MGNGSMKNWVQRLLLPGIIAALLVSCNFLEERTSKPPAVTPLAGSTMTPAVPTKTANPPATAVLQAATATTEATEPALLPTVTFAFPPATTTSEPGPPPTPEGNATGPLPTATMSASAGDPLINFFRANVEETDPGNSITLEWSTTNAMTVTLWHLVPTGQFGDFWTVSESGSFDYPVGMRERNQTTFALSAIDEQGSNEMVTVAVTIRCPDEWFFSNPPDICPATAALYSAAAEQQFERGTMIWIAGEDRIYVLFGDGQQYAWQAYSDEWSQGEPENDPNLAPPSGLYQPVRGFGQVWREQPEVMDRLGWAVSEENAYDAAIQRTSFAKYNETYIGALDGALWRLMAERSDWLKINPRANS